VDVAADCSSDCHAVIAAGAAFSVGAAVGDNDLCLMGVRFSWDFDCGDVIGVFKWAVVVNDGRGHVGVSFGGECASFLDGFVKCPSPSFSK